MKDNNDPVMHRARALLRALYDENEGSRNSAAKQFHRHLREHGLHPDDLVLDRRGEQHERYQRVLEYTQRELTEAQRRLDFLKQRIEPKLWSQAERAGGVANRWVELTELASRRLGGLQRGWKARVRMMIGVGEKPFRAWERGLAPIPDTAFEALRTVVVPPAKVVPRPPAPPHQNESEARPAL